MNVVTTWKGHLYLGLKEGYDGNTFDVDSVKKWVREYVDRAGWCVTVTETTFVYSGGEEKGVIIGAVQYPRFPKEVKEIENDLYSLALLLMYEFKQYRCTVEYPDRSILVENEELVGNEGDRT